MATLANIQNEYKYALQDVANLLEIDGSNTVRDAAIKSGIREYSRKFPAIKTALVAVVGSGYYAVPSGWQDALSRIISVEHPIDQSPPAYLSPKSWRVVRRESTQVIYLDPNPSASFRLTYTAPHDVTNPATIPDDHEGPVGRWAASIAAIEFAAKYAGSVQNNVDAVNYRSKEQEWRAVSEALRATVMTELAPYAVAHQRAADYRTYFSAWEV